MAISFYRSRRLFLVALCIGSVVCFQPSCSAQQQRSAKQSLLYATNTSPISTLIDTTWQLRLDVGIQPGTWMPKRYPGWGESGARLGIGGLKVQFIASPWEDNDSLEPLVGPREDTRVLHVTSPPSTFVSERGQEIVRFDRMGGWCIQRPNRRIRNASGDSVQPEGLLKFWLDCSTGAKRQDVEILPRTRIFFTTGVWDDTRVVDTLETEYQHSLQQLEQLMETTQTNKQQMQNQNLWQQLGTWSTMVGDAREYDTLKAKCLQLGQQLPPTNSPSSKKNGCIVAPNGSLVIKGTKKDWLPTDEYLILGTFAVTNADDDDDEGR